MIKTTMIWLVLTVFAARVHADCPIASYPRRTTLGTHDVIQAILRHNLMVK